MSETKKIQAYLKTMTRAQKLELAIHLQRRKREQKEQARLRDSR